MLTWIPHSDRIFAISKTSFLSKGSPPQMQVQNGCILQIFSAILKISSLFRKSKFDLDELLKQKRQSKLHLSVISHDIIIGPEREDGIKPLCLSIFTFDK